VHVWSVDYLDAVFAGYEMFYCQDFVGCESAQYMRQAQRFRVALHAKVVSQKFLNRVNSVLTRNFAVDIQPESVVCLV
jgi:hypothetical protein